MHVRRALALALTFAVPLLLAGCSEKAEPTPKMPDPTSSSPSPTESEMPEAESAEDFIRRWVRVSDAMQQTGDVAEFRQLSRNCQACGQVADQVASIYKSGGSIDFEGSEVMLLNQIASSPPTFHLDLKTAETIIRNADGSVEQRLPEGTGKYLVTVNGKPDAWFVGAYGRR